MNRIGLANDPCWALYRQYSWGRLPLHFPVCRVDVEHVPTGSTGLELHLTMDRGLPMVCRVDDPLGGILLELAPQPSLGCGEGPDVTSAVRELDASTTPDEIGIGFDWVFHVPVRRYQPTKPLGMVRTGARPLAGHALRITIVRTAGEPATT